MIIGQEFLAIGMKCCSNDRSAAFIVMLVKTIGGTLCSFDRVCHVNSLYNKNLTQSLILNIYIYIYIYIYVCVCVCVCVESAFIANVQVGRYCTLEYT